MLPIGIDDFNNPTARGANIKPGSVDGIVTVQCLCSIPKPEKNVQLLNDYLKKGGRWVYRFLLEVHDRWLPSLSFNEQASGGGWPLGED